MALQLKIASFEGPLDLLLHLIKQEEIDIYDIPIAKITSQYLTYLQQLQASAIDVAGDYFVMAATLMAIKSKMLLPVSPVDEAIAADENESVDPRAELVAQLLSYQAFQKVADQLEDFESERQQFFAKPASPGPDKISVPLEPGVVNSTALFAAVQRLIARRQHLEPVLKTVAADAFSVGEQTQLIQERLQRQTEFTFVSLLNPNADVEEIVATFLAVLELMKRRQILCRQDQVAGPLILHKREAA